MNLLPLRETIYNCADNAKRCTTHVNCDEDKCLLEIFCYWVYDDDHEWMTNIWRETEEERGWFINLKLLRSFFLFALFWQTHTCHLQVSIPHFCLSGRLSKYLKLFHEHHRLSMWTICLLFPSMNFMISHEWIFR